MNPLALLVTIIATITAPQLTQTSNHALPVPSSSTDTIEKSVDFDHLTCKTDEKNALEKEFSDYKYQTKCLFLGASISVIVSMMGYKYMRDKELSNEVDRFHNGLQTIISRELASINKLIQTSGYDVGIIKNDNQRLVCHDYNAPYEYIIQLDFNNEQDVRALIQKVEDLFEKYVNHAKEIQKLHEELMGNDWICLYKNKNNQWVPNTNTKEGEMKGWEWTSIVLYFLQKMKQSDKISSEFSSFFKILDNLNVLLSHKKAKLWGVSDSVAKISSTFTRYQFEMALLKNKLKSKFGTTPYVDTRLRWFS